MSETSNRPSLRSVTLDDIAESIVDGPFGSSLKTSDYVESGVPVLQGKNITGNQFVWKEVRYISEKKAAQLKRSSTVVGDHLLVKIGSIGYSAILDDLNGHAFAVIPANLARIRPNHSAVDDQYLHRVLTSEGVVRHFQKVASKTAQPALSLKKIRTTPIPLPPLDEQKRLAAILDAADALRAKRRESLVELDALLQSTFLEMFGDPVTNPMGWDKPILESICRPKQWPTIKKTQLLDCGFPVYGANGQIGFYSEYNHAEATVLITCRGATCGTINVCVPMSYVTGNAMTLDDLDIARVELRFLAHALEVTDFTSVITGVAQPQITRQSLRQLSVPVPPLDLQRRFARIVESIEQQKAVQRAHLAELDTLFASLQSRAFRGEI